MKLPSSSDLLRHALVATGTFLAALLGAGCGGHPPILALSPRAGCSLWVGDIRGNDRATMELELCPLAGDDGRVVGRVQLTSPRSGWSIREVEGHLDEDGTLRMHDVGFALDWPEPGWMFCLIDDYELTRNRPDRAAGHYDSNACGDHAAIRLRRAAREEEARCAR